MFARIKRWPIKPYKVGNSIRRPLNQLLEGDMVYVRDFIVPTNLSDEQLKHLALITHHVYSSFDLTLRCLLYLQQRGRLSASIPKNYIAMVGRH